MVYINIPYVAENDRIEAHRAQAELEALSISESAKHYAFAAIYNKRPRGVSFDDPNEAIVLQRALYRLGVPYRASRESDYKYELLSQDVRRENMSYHAENGRRVTEAALFE
jgi:hypothetical protein